MGTPVSRGTVNASVSVSSSGSAIQDGVDSALKATVKDYTNSNPLAVVIVDTNGDATGGSAVSISNGSDVAEGATTDAKVLGDNTGTVNAHLRGIDTILNDSWDSGNHWQKVSVQNATLAVTQSGSWATEVQYVEDAAAPANPTGNALLAVREDARAGSLVSTDGDFVALRGNNVGELYVKHTDAIPVTDNSGSLSVDWNGTQPVTGSGNATGALRVEIANNGTGLSTVNPGTAANWGVYVEDAGETAGGNLMMAGTVRRDSVASSAGTTGDNATLNTDANGRLWATVVVDTALPAGSNAIGKLAANSGVTIGAVEIAAAQTLATVTNVATIGTSVTPGTGATNLGKLEDGAHTSGDVGVMALAVRQSTATDLSAGATNGDYEPLQVNTRGAQWVAIEDGAGGQITSFGGGTQYTEDAAAAADPVGTTPILVRKDTPATIVSTDGDNVAQRGTNYGAAYVQVVSSSGAFIDSFGGSGGTAMTDDAAFTVGSTTFTPAGGTYKSTRDAVDDNDGGTFAMNAKRAMYVSLETPNSDSVLDDTLDAVKVVNATAANLLVTASAGTNLNTSALALESGGNLATVAALSRAEDAAHSTGHTGVMALGVRNATATDLSAGNTDGDYEPFQVDANGCLHVIGRANASTNIAQVAGATVATGHGTASGALRVELPTDGTGLVTVNPGTAANWGIYVEDAAETAAGNLVMVGAVRRDSAASSSGTTGDNSTINTDANGNLWVNASGQTLTVGSHAVTNAGTFAVQESGAALTSLQLIDDVVFAEDSTHVSGDKGIMALAVRAATPIDRSAGPTAGDYEPLAVNSSGAVWCTPTPESTGGWSMLSATSGDALTALTNSKQTIKASAGVLGGWYIYNPNTSATYVILYNTDTVTVGTTNPQLVLCIPPGAAANIEMTHGINFSTAISCAATTTGGGNGAPATALEANFWYK